MVSQHPRGPKSLIVKLGSEIGDFRFWEIEAAPLHPQHPRERVGGRSPHPFPWVLGRQGAIWNQKSQQCQARLLKIRNIGPRGCGSCAFAGPFFEPDPFKGILGTTLAKNNPKQQKLKQKWLFPQKLNSAELKGPRQILRIRPETFHCGPELGLKRSQTKP